MLASPTYYPAAGYGQAAPYSGYVQMPPPMQPPYRTPILNPLQQTTSPIPRTFTSAYNNPRADYDHQRTATVGEWKTQYTDRPPYSHRSVQSYPFPQPQPPPQTQSQPQQPPVLPSRLLTQLYPPPPPPPHPPRPLSRAVVPPAWNDRTVASYPQSAQSYGGGADSAPENHVQPNDKFSDALLSHSLRWTREPINESEQIPPITATSYSSHPPGAFPSYSVAADSFNLMAQLALKRRERLFERTNQATLSVNSLPAATRYMSVLRSAHKLTVAEALAHQQLVGDGRAYKQRYPIVQLTDISVRDVNIAFDTIAPPSPTTGRRRDILTNQSSFDYMKELISTIRHRSLQAKAPSIPPTPHSSTTETVAAQFAAASVGALLDLRSSNPPTSLIDGAVANTSYETMPPLSLPTFTPFADDTDAAERRRRSFAERDAVALSRARQHEAEIEQRRVDEERRKAVEEELKRVEAERKAARRAAALAKRAGWEEQQEARRLQSTRESEAKAAAERARLETEAATAAEGERLRREAEERELERQRNELIEQALADQRAREAAEMVKLEEERQRRLQYDREQTELAEAEYFRQAAIDRARTSRRHRTFTDLSQVPHRPPFWVTEADRAELFDWFCSDGCLLFIEDVSFNDRQLDEILVSGGSLDGAVQVLMQMNSMGMQFMTVFALHGEMAAVRAELGILSPKRQKPPTPPPTPPIPEFIPAEWITAAHRDALFEWLASEQCLLFRVDVKLNNAALNALLTAGGSFDSTMIILQSLNRDGLSFSSVNDLVVTVEQAVASNPPVVAPAEPAEPEAPVPEWITEADRDALFELLADPSYQFFTTDVKLNNRALNNMLRAGGSLQHTLDLLNQLRSQQHSFDSVDELIIAFTSHFVETQTTVERDALFAYLSSEQCHLFVNDAKLSNDVLNSILLAGNGISSTLACCYRLDELGYQYERINDLCFAVKNEFDLATERTTELLGKLQSVNSSQKFFLQPVPLTIDVVADLYFNVQAGSDTVEYVEQIEKDIAGDRFPPFHSWAAFLLELHNRHESVRTARWQEMDDVHQFMQLHSGDVLMEPIPPSISMRDCALIAQAGREDLFALHSSLSLDILNEMMRAGEHCKNIETLTVAVRGKRAISKKSWLDGGNEAAQPPPPPAVDEFAQYRDELFEFLASEECTLFSTDVKLSNKALDSLLLAGRHSLETTLLTCRALMTDDRTFVSVDDLRDAIMDKLDSQTNRKPPKSAFSNGRLSARPSARSTKSSSGRPKTNKSLSSWITPADRDAVFEFIANESNLFAVDVKLNNAALDSFLFAGASRQATLKHLRQFDDEEQSFDRVQDLAAAIEAAARGNRPITSHTARAITAQRSISLRQWSAADRDALFDYLAHDDCSVFSADVKLNNAALDSLLTAGNGIQQTTDILKHSVEESGLRYSTVAMLVSKLKQHANDSYSTPFETSTVPPLAAARKISDTDRDNLFAFLASEECCLFSTNVKLSNSALNTMIHACSLSVDMCIALCAYINATSLQFASIDALVDAITAAFNAAHSHLSTIHKYLLTNQKTLFKQPISISAETVHRLYVTAQAGADTMTLIRSMHASINAKTRLSSFDSLVDAILKARQQFIHQSQEDLIAVHNYFSTQSPELLPNDIVLSLHDCYIIGQSAADPHAESETASVEYMMRLHEQGQFYQTVDQLCEAINRMHNQNLTRFH